METFILFMLVIGWLPALGAAAMSPISACEPADAVAVLEAWKARRADWAKNVTEARHEAGIADVQAWSAAKRSFATHRS